MASDHFKQLGEPNIRISGLQIWIHGRQFPDSDDYWDGNWLRVSVHCGGEGADVWASGSFIHLSELYGWKISSESLYETLQGIAKLDCMEPELNVLIQAESNGKLEMKVSLTPNNLTQEHKFLFEIDQSYLPSLIRSCKKVLETYPIKGESALTEHNN